MYKISKQKKIKSLSEDTFLKGTQSTAEYTGKFIKNIIFIFEFKANVNIIEFDKNNKQLSL